MSEGICSELLFWQRKAKQRRRWLNRLPLQDAGVFFCYLSVLCSPLPMKQGITKHQCA
jgi:hypothetical protein